MIGAATIQIVIAMDATGLNATSAASLICRLGPVISMKRYHYYVVIALKNGMKEFSYYAQTGGWKVKDHEYAKIINNLRDAAVSHKDCQSMREALSGVVRPLIDENRGWQECGNEIEKLINPHVIEQANPNDLLLHVSLCVSERDSIAQYVKLLELRRGTLEDAINKFKETKTTGDMQAMFDLVI